MVGKGACESKEEAKYELLFVRNYNGQESMKKLIGFMTITHECHNSCVFCGAKELGIGMMLSKATAKKQIDDWYAMGARTIVVSGGEPLHHKDLLDVISYSKKAGFGRVIMYTTADFKISNYSAVELEAAGLDRVNVSLFGHSSKYHDGVARKKGSFNNTLEGLREFSSTSIMISLNTPVNKANHKYLPDFVEVIKENVPLENLRAWQLSDIHPTPEANTRPNLQVSYNELRPILETVTEKCERHGIKFFFQEFPLCVVYPWIESTQELVNAFDSKLISPYEYNSTEYIVEEPLSSPFKRFDKKCEDCALRSACKGFTPGYDNTFGTGSELTPISDVEISQLVQEAQNKWEPLAV